MNKFGLKIIVEDTAKEFHTYDDMGLYIQNTDYIGEPQQVRNLVYIPGRNGYLDLSKTNDGRIIYSSRPISVELGGFRNKHHWDSVISDFRNNINGRICKFIFDNDQGFYWRGRTSIKEFASKLSLGTFRLEMSEAEPYKYSIQTSADPWKWDPFNFETGIITYVDAITINGTKAVIIPHGYMPVCPEFIVSNKTGTLTVVYDGTTYELSSGRNKIPSIMVAGDDDVTLTFTGNAKVEIVYRSGSL